MKFLSRSEELVLLAVWCLKEDAYCVPIRRYVSRISKKDWSFGAVYVPLNRLEKKGMLDSSLGPPESKRGGRKKRFYRLSSMGMEALEEVRNLHKAMWEGIPEFSRK
jgi:DNA-binding PadR family transcriptional regulator